MCSELSVEASIERDMNAIIAIHPYKYQGLWVFDDTRVCLVQEPFVSGADEIIERMVQGIFPSAVGIHAALFGSTIPWSSIDVGMEWRRSDIGGTGTTVLWNDPVKPALW